MQLEVNNQNNDPAARLMAQKYIMYENKNIWSPVFLQRTRLLTLVGSNAFHSSPPSFFSFSFTFSFFWPWGI